MSQEKRPAYHRRQDLKRLREVAAALPLIVSDTGQAYTVATFEGEGLCAGRYEVIYQFLRGYAAGAAARLTL